MSLVNVAIQAMVLDHSVQTSTSLRFGLRTFLGQVLVRVQHVNNVCSITQAIGSY